MDLISKQEIIETKNILLSFLEKASENEINFFQQNPIQTLRNLGVSLINRISRLRLAGLSTYIKNLINKVKSAFKEWRNCAACKIALKVVFFAFATALNIPIAAMVNHLELANLLSDFFNQTKDVITTYLSSLGISIGEFNLFEINDLIERLCSKFGYCS